VGTRSTLLAIFVGGAAGTVARALLADAWPLEAGHWPWATFAVNVVGSALLGWVVAGERHHRLLGIGFCGSLTTFSTFQLELLQMVDDGRVATAVVYAAASVAAGLLAVAVGGRRRVA
jgi:CrcB protein